MASYTHVFGDEETTNWFKACIALIITKDGLSDFIDREIQNVHTAVGRSCGQCSIENMIKCPTPGICENKYNCKFHNTPARQYKPCPTYVCNQVVANIKKQHRYIFPSWKNTSAKRWTTNHWEIAKCFCPREGYLYATSVGDTDFNGVINILLNCRYFDQKFSFCIASGTSAQPCILTTARQIGRDVRHSPDCNVNGTILHGYFMTLAALLADSQCLIHDSTAQKALIKLQQLQNDSLTISHIEMGIILKEAQATLEMSKQVAINSGQQISQQLLKALMDIQSKVSYCQKEIDERTQRGIEKIASAEKSAITRISQVMLDTDSQATDRNIKEFFDRLIQHYVPISPRVQSINRNIRELHSLSRKISRHSSAKTKSTARFDDLHTHKGFDFVFFVVCCYFLYLLCAENNRI